MDILNLKTIYQMLRQVAFIPIAITLTGCVVNCEQDYGPPWEETTNDNPYMLSYYSSDLSIDGVRWKNITTGDAGHGDVGLEDKCIWPLGCYTWSHLTMYIPLVDGLNTVYVYEDDGECEWREDYLITYN